MLPSNSLPRHCDVLRAACTAESLSTATRAWLFGVACASPVRRLSLLSLSFPSRCVEDVTVGNGAPFPVGCRLCEHERGLLLYAGGDRLVGSREERKLGHWQERKWHHFVQCHWHDQR